MFTAILLAVALVTTITVDLGPAVRGLAERAGSSYLKRDLTIGRLSIRLLNGAFVVENLRIGGLQPADRPFLTARTIEVSMSFARAAPSRSADRLGRDDRLADGGRDLAERAAQLPEVHAGRSKAARSEADS